MSIPMRPNVDSTNDAVSRFVELDSQSPIPDEQFGDWTIDDLQHSDTFMRCLAATSLIDKLRDDSDISWAFYEAAALAKAPPRAVWRREAISWYRQPALAWSIAGALATVVLILWLGPRGGLRSMSPPYTAIGASGQIDAGEPPALLVNFGATEPVVLLPGDIAVDARSVAVLPFATEGQAGNSPVANELYQMVIEQLARIPGMYVVGSDMVQAYADYDLPLDQLAAQLGVRGIVQASVGSEDGRVNVVLSVIDASRDRQLANRGFERPFGEMSEMRTDIAAQIAQALVSPEGSLPATGAQ